MTKAWTIRAIGILLAGGLGYIGYLFVTGGSKMQTFCESIQAGDPVENATTRAHAHGYTTREISANQLLIIDSDAMGRFICGVTISDGKVVAAVYVHND